MKLSSIIEKKLLSLVKDIFVNNPWDFKHTLSTVKAMKEIAGAEWANERILLTVMYLHDIGYAGKLKENYTLGERISVKKEHMNLGAKKASEILEKLKFSSEEKEKIIHLISVHDKLDELSTRDELLVLEADSLGQIDPSVGNNFGEEEFAKYVKIFEEKRVPKFITRTGKKLLLEYAHNNERYQKYTTLFKK